MRPGPPLRRTPGRPLGRRKLEKQTPEPSRPAALGSSPDALVLATSTGHSDFYVQVVEDIATTHLRISGTTSRDVRADMVLVKQPAGGAVFSASAISFLGSLSHNGYDNNVSHLLANVLGEFMRRPGKRSARERVHEIAPS